MKASILVGTAILASLAIVPTASAIPLCLQVVPPTTLDKPYLDIVAAYGPVHEHVTEDGYRVIVTYLPHADPTLSIEQLTYVLCYEG